MNEAMGQWGINSPHIYNLNTGNVGIGTNSPGYLLHVSKNMLAPSIRIQNAGGTGGAAFEMIDNFSGADWKFKATNAGGFKIRDHANGLDVFFIEQNSAANLLYLKSGGNIGIGTDNPEAKLDVNGDLKVAGKISNVTDPTDAQDAATKAYVDLLESNVDILLEEIEFLKNLSGIGSVSDIEGNIYKTILIGTQVWMAENLCITRYNDNTAIPIVTDNTAWEDLTSPGYCWYSNDSSTYASTYGALYNYYTVADTNSRNVCPVGWHVPSDAEWLTLSTYLGGTTAAGGKMKEAGLAHWNAPNTDATNESGFTGLSGGHRLFFGVFEDVGNFGKWWSSSEVNTIGAWLRYLYYNNGGLGRDGDEKRSGFSVRCLRDN